jgi:hypothetical protein
MGSKFWAIRPSRIESYIVLFSLVVRLNDGHTQDYFSTIVQVRDQTLLFKTTTFGIMFGLILFSSEVKPFLLTMLSKALYLVKISYTSIALSDIPIASM